MKAIWIVLWRIHGGNFSWELTLQNPFQIPQKEIPGHPQSSPRRARLFNGEFPDPPGHRGRAAGDPPGLPGAPPAEQRHRPAQAEQGRVDGGGRVARVSAGTGHGSHGDERNRGRMGADGVHWWGWEWGLYDWLWIEGEKPVLRYVFNRYSVPINN